MRSTSAGTVAILALLASPAFATPLPAAVKPPVSSSSSGSGIGSVIAGGAVSRATSGVVGGLLNQIEGLFSRDDLNAEHAKRDLASIIQDASTLSPDDRQTVKTALMNKISTLEESDVGARAIASLVGGALASGAASAVVGGLLSQIETLFRRDEFDVQAKRDLASIIQDASALPPAEKETVKTALMNKISTLEESDGVARRLGTVGGAVAGGATAAVVGGLLNQIGSLFGREAQLEGLERRAVSAKPPSTSSGGGLGSAVAGGAVAATVGNLLGQIEGLFSRHNHEATDGTVSEQVESLSRRDDSLLTRTEGWAINELD
jgi:hypothetical protein